ncbi:unnamed protein product [Owenia fusiformis]|uniref:GRIP domain-containing protein n=1 Tax=Owenia fusiformis TaxID=6347 RepID=A0A8S4PG05_OWEFU|nr:unnamed protein product [Owenia fusiformis]
MSWIGGSLSNITGQISNFTKEVLTEGTEEIDDHVTELSVAKERIVALDGHIESQRAEIQRLKKANTDLEVQLESSELHANSLSVEYRGQIQQKDNEIKALKQKELEWLDIQKTDAVQRDVSHSTLPPSQSAPNFSSLSHTGFDEDESGLSDALALQQEVNRLHAQVRKLQVENNHWRQEANKTQAPGNEGTISHYEELQSLQAEIKELREKLHHEVEEHQQEIAALHELQRQKVSTLKARHKTQITELEERLSETQDSDDGPSNELQEMYKQLQTSQASVQELQNTIDRQNKEKSILKDELLKNSESLKLAKESIAEFETTKGSYNEKIQHLEMLLDFRKDEGSTASNSKEDSNIQADHDVQNRLLSAQVKELQSRIQNYEDEIEQFELVRADWTSEKEAMENILMKLKSELQEKDMSLLLLQAKTGLDEEEGKVEQQDADSQSTDSDSKNKATVEIEDLKKRNEELEASLSEIQNNSQYSSEDVDALERSLHEAESKATGLKEENEQLVQSLEELDQQHEVAVTQIITARDQLQVQLKSIQSMNQGLQEQMDALNSQVLSKNEEIKELEKDLRDELDQKLQELEDTQEELNRSVSKNSTAEQALNNMRKHAEERERNVTNLQKQLRSMVQEKEQLKQRVEQLQKHVTPHQEMNFEDPQQFGQQMATEALRDQVSMLEDDKQRLQDKLDDLLSQLMRQRQHENNNEEEIILLQEAFDAQAVELTTTQNDNEKLTKEMEELTAKVKTKEFELQVANKARNDLATQVQALLTKTESNELQTQNEDDTVKAKLAEVIQLNQELENEITTQKQVVAEYQSQIEAKDKEMGNIKQQLEKGAMAINDLHMDKKELDKKVKDLQEKLVDLQKAKSDVVKEKRALEKDKRNLEKSCKTLEQKLNTSREELWNVSQTAVDVNSHDTLKNELKHLKSQLNDSLVASDNYQGKIEALEKDMNQMELSMKLTESEKSDIEEKLNNSESQVESLTKEIAELRDSKLQDLNTQIEALKTEKEYLKKELEDVEEKMHDQKVHYDKYIKTLTESREMNADNLQVEHDKLMKQSHQQDVAMSDIKTRFEQLEEELVESKEMLQSTLDGQQPLKEALDEQNEELRLLKADNSKYHQKTTDMTNQLQKQADELKEFHEKEKQRLNLLEDNHRLNDQVSSLKVQLDSDKIESQTLDVITDLESEITSLQNQITQHKTEITKLNTDLMKNDSEINRLQQIVKDQSTKLKNQEKVIKDYSQDLENQHNISDQQQQSLTEQKIKLEELSENETKLKKELQDMKDELTDMETSIVKERLNGSLVNENRLQNGDVEENGHDDEFIIPRTKEVMFTQEQMRESIASKDSIISDLQENNNSLLKMLENQSLGNYGSRVLVDVHKLQSQVRTLQTEKEQIMAILSEKTREASTLKSEVHRLMSVISAEKSAIAKLQQDNTELTKKRENPNEDMHKETVQKLSTMIRDKDMEIEALTQKNHTLLQVLQDSSNDGTHINNLVHEKENLAKQLQMYINDREHLVAAVNQKHQESLAYHNESQKLNASLIEDIAKREKLEQEHSKLMQEFEEKQKAYLKTQNELVNYKQKFTELDNKYTESKQKSDSTSQPIAVDLNNTVELSVFEEKCQEVDHLAKEITTLNQSINEKEITIDKMNAQMTESNAKLNSSQNTITTKDTEISNLKREIDNTAFQLQTVKNEMNDALRDKQNLEQHIQELTSENTFLKESQTRLTMSNREKDFEVESLKEKAATLTALVTEKDGARGETERLLVESEAMQTQAKTFQHERDQVMLALQQREQEIQQLNAQLAIGLEREAKLEKKLERLQGHLIQIEEAYTREALDSEEREKELRNKLLEAEERANSQSNAVQTASEHASHQVSNMEKQLHAMAEQRDASMLQLATTQEQLQQYAAALNNLQMVLEQFQMEKQAMEAASSEKHQQELSAAKLVEQQLRAQLNNMEIQLQETTSALEAAERLSEQLDRKEDVIRALKEEVLLREAACTKAEEELQKLLSVNQDRVDKIVIKNLFVGYFGAGYGKRNDVLKLISNVLDFTHEDNEKVGLEQPPGASKWLPGFLRGTTPTPPSTPRATKKPDPNGSFSQLFVKFLEVESTPTKVPTLPAEEMAKEELQKQKTPFNPFSATSTPQGYRHTQGEHPQGPGFNPFSAARHASVPLQTTLQLGDKAKPETMSTSLLGGAQDSSHLLMQPPAPSMPMFGSLTLPSNESTAPGNKTNSGRNTPSNILKDVLQTDTSKT